jgi:GDP-4-dehydro-6-deoxy-D-mannose reductase
MSIIVAGINGFVGHHVVEALKRHGQDIIGLGREPEATADVMAAVQEYVVCDLADETAVAALDLAGVSSIINVAGFAKVGVSDTERDAYRTVNVNVHRHLAERIKREYPGLRMISVSSGAVYAPDQPMPLSEESRILGPDDAPVYAASKLYMEEALRPYQIAGLDIVITRPFNHSGPGQQPGFLIPDLARKLQDAPADKPVIPCGNLHTRRDYSHVSDVAEAYVRLATAPSLPNKLYNIASGRSVEGTEIFKLLAAALGKPDATFKVDPSLARADDPAELYGSSARLQADTGWQPARSIEDTVRDYAEWLKQQ